MLGVEGGNQIGGSMPTLRQFYARGVRYMTLTHNQTTDWADAATDEPKHDGLNAFGVEVVKEMNSVNPTAEKTYEARATLLVTPVPRDNATLATLGFVARVQDDYAAANVPMLPAVVSIRKTARPPGKPFSFGA